MSRRHPLLNDLQNALDGHNWDEAERLLHEALQLGLMHTRYGLPLRYLLADLPNRRVEAADRAATAHMAEAAALAQAGQHEAARLRYEQAGALPDISPVVAEQVAAALAALNDELDYGSPQDPVVEQELEAAMAGLIDAIRQQQPDLARLMAACALPLWWDEPLLAAIRNRDDGREPVIAEKLSRFSFVYQWPDYYTYSRLARRLLLQQWDNDSGDSQAINTRILHHLRQRLADQPPTEPAAYERLVAAHLRHTFLDDPAAGALLLGQLFQQAEDEYRLEAARQYVLVLRDVLASIPAGFAAYVDYAEGWLHHLHRRENAALLIFRRLALRNDLPPDLQARVARGLAAVLVEQEQWVEAAEHYRRALVLFTAQQNESEAADTMVGLGGAYLGIASAASGRGDEFAPRPGRSWWFPRLVGFLARLPLVLFLLLRLGLPWSWRGWQRLGEGLDWVVARLFSDAILWFQQAGRLYEKLGHSAGQQRTHLALGRLYLALNHPLAASAMLRRVSAPPGSYAAARAGLALAEALIGRGDEAAAAPLLQAALPVFVRLKHDRRIAQTQSWLGYLAAQAQKPEEAMTAYGEALVAWQRLDEPARATDVIHAMEALARRADLSPAARTMLAEVQERTVTLVYESRFVHPVMALFQRLASVTLWLVLMFAVMTSVRSEAGTTLGVDVTLKRPTQQEARAAEAFRPAVGEADAHAVLLAVTSQVTPDLRPHFLGGVLAGALAAYLALYTALGLALIATTTMSEIQAQQARRLELDRRGVASAGGEHRRRWLSWPSVRTLLANQRLIFGYLLTFVSSVTLLGGDTEINIDGRTRHYLALTRDELPNRLPHTRKLDTGYNLPYGFFGWFFLVVLAFLSIFVALLVVESPLATRSLPFLPYTPADLYGVLFVAGALPLVYWFVIQPLRNQSVRAGARTALRVAALGALALSVAAWLQFVRWHFPLGRPDIVLSVLALLLAGFVLRQHFAGEDGARRRQASLGLVALTPVGRVRGVAGAGVVSAALLAGGLALWTAGQELRNFHDLAQAKVHFLQAEALRSSRPAQAEAEYDQAQRLYSAALALRAEPYVYNNLGNVYAQLGQYAEAVVAYEEAVKRNAADLTYKQNLALAYREWARETRDGATRNARFGRALDGYQEILAQIAQTPEQGGKLTGLERSTRELRAATWFDLGQPDDLEMALADYEWLIEHYPQDPAGYVGKGWSLHALRTTVPAAERAARRVYLEQAVAAFTSALEQDAGYTPAYNGLGWMHWFISSEAIEGNCIVGISDPVVKEDYVRQIEAAVQAFNRGVSVDEANGFFFRTRAQLHYILGFCGPPYDKLSEFLKAIGDYYIAVSLDPRPEWYYTLGGLHLAAAQLATDREQTTDVLPNLLAGARSQLSAIRVDANYGPARDRLRDLYISLGRTEAQALDDILTAMHKKGSDADLVALAQSELQRGVFGLAATALERVVARSPQHGEAWLLLTRTMYRWAATYEGANRPGRYARAIEAAQQALAIDEGLAEAHLILGRAYLQQGAYEAARRALGRAAALLPNDPAVAFELGLTYVGLGDVEAARSSYAAALRAVQQLPEQADRTERYAAAIADLLKLPAGPAAPAAELVFLLVDTTLAEQNVAVMDGAGYFELGNAAFADKQHQVALPLLVQAVRLAPQDFHIWNPLRDTLINGYGASETGSGDAVLTIILAVTPDARAYEALVAIAQSEVDRGVFGLAVAALDRALALQPDGLSAALLKALAYQRWGDRYPGSGSAPGRYRAALEAAQLAETLLLTNTTAVDAEQRKGLYLIQGRAHYQLRQWAESVRAYAKAAASDPQDAATWRTLGRAAYLGDDYAQALAALGEAATLAPGEPDHHFYQGLVYVVQGDRAGAEGAYAAGIEAALAASPEVRSDRLEKALADLRSVQAGAADLAGEFVALLEGVE
jgi:tetratricopeptide (TPR) repeat protein